MRTLDSTERIKGCETYFVVWQDYEGATACGLHDDREKLRVHGTEGRVPRGLGHPYIVVALFTLQGRPVHVAELAATHNTERHICTYFRVGRSNEKRKKEREMKVSKEINLKKPDGTLLAAGLYYDLFLIKLLLRVHRRRRRRVDHPRFINRIPHSVRSK